MGRLCGGSGACLALMLGRAHHWISFNLEVLRCWCCVGPSIANQYTKILPFFPSTFDHLLAEDEQAYVCDTHIGANNVCIES